MEKAPSYEEAFKELQEIAAEIESEHVAVDVLAQSVKRASELIAYCQDKLRFTEKEVDKIIARMEKKS